MEIHSYILDGQLYQGSTITLQAQDLGLAQGLGCFETLWAPANSTPFAAAEHFTRLQSSCARLKLACPTLEELLTHTQHLRQVLGLAAQESRIRWTLWEQQPQTFHYLITAKPAQRVHEAARVQLSPHRLHSQAPLAGHKTTSYAAFTLMLREAKQAGFHEAAYCNESGELVEGATSNLFFLRQEGEQIHLHTPPLLSGCLPGVTRAHVLKLLKKPEFAAIELQQAPLKPNDIAQFQAAFLTNSQVGIRPISQFGQQHFLKQHSMLERLSKEFEHLRCTPSN